MTFLPIAEREMRVASRRYYTYWSRVGAAGIALLIFGIIMTFSLLNSASGIPWSAGMIQFSVMKWMAFVFAAANGVFLTSDSLSEEKREGTIGLLFLTDLRGRDIVLGKLISQSLQAFYGLLAAFPLLALPLLSGGVSGAEFGRSMLILCNTLFFSLAIGMFVSSISREVVKTMNGAVLLILLFLIGLPWLDWTFSGWNSARFHAMLSHASPGYLFVMQSGMRPGDFWTDFAVQHFLAWTFLALSAVCLRWTWQDKSRKSSGAIRTLLQWWRFGGRRTRVRLRRKLLEINPILWLASRDRWMVRIVSLTLIVLSGWICLRIYFDWGSGQIWQHLVSAGAEQLTLLFLTLWIATQSSRVFLEAIHNGAMELILVTPLETRRIVRGQWMALVRTFAIPLLAILALTLAAGLQGIHVAKLANVRSPTSAPNSFNYVLIQEINLICGLINIFMFMPAIAWFGMWMGVTSRKTSSAVLKILCFACVIPWFIEVFVQIAGLGILGRIWPSVLGGSFPYWLRPLAVSAMELAKNIAFIAWSRRKLLTDFRDAASRGGQNRLARKRRPQAAISIAQVPNPLNS